MSPNSLEIMLSNKFFLLLFQTKQKELSYKKENTSATHLQHSSSPSQGTVFSWIIGHSGEDGRYVNSHENSGGGAFKDGSWVLERHRYFNDREKLLKWKDLRIVVAITEKSYFLKILHWLCRTFLWSGEILGMNLSSKELLKKTMAASLDTSGYFQILNYEKASKAYSNLLENSKRVILSPK